MEKTIGNIILDNTIIPILFNEKKYYTKNSELYSQFNIKDIKFLLLNPWNDSLVNLCIESNSNNIKCTYTSFNYDFVAIEIIGYGNDMDEATENCKNIIFDIVKSKNNIAIMKELLNQL